MKTIYGKDIFIPDFPVHIVDTVILNNQETYSHNHDFYEFFIVKEGMMYHNINGEIQRLAEKSLCLAAPDDVHFFWKESSVNRAVFTNVAFSKELFNQTYCFLFGEAVMETLSRGIASVSLCHDSYKVLLEKSDSIKNIATKITESKLLSLVKSLIADVLTLFYFSNNNNPKKMPMWLLNACNDMKREENYITGLKRFIEISGKSQEHLTRYIKRYYGISPTAYINSCRLNKVAQMLVSTDMNVIQIAYSAGFESIAHFNKLFKKQYGVTPAVYRRINTMTANPL
jgi:AraC family transcriptional regulator, dual regulator of chb operon